jgi:hypothetical protein
VQGTQHDCRRQKQPRVPLDHIILKSRHPAFYPAPTPCVNHLKNLPFFGLFFPVISC